MRSSWIASPRSRSTSLCSSSVTDVSRNKFRRGCTASSKVCSAAWRRRAPIQGSALAPAAGAAPAGAPGSRPAAGAGSASPGPSREASSAMDQQRCGGRARAAAPAAGSWEQMEALASRSAAQRSLHGRENSEPTLVNE